MTNELLNGFFRFLDSSPTSWHAAREISDRLAEADFTPLSEKESWKLERGKGYFVVRDDAAVAAFRLPKKAPSRAVILASHLDSPSLKLKPIPEIGTANQISQFSTEVYGSPLLHTWLDRDLALAGRAIVKTAGGQRESKLVFLDDYPLIIPSLAIHLDRTIADKGLQINKQDHLRPIVSLAKERTLSLETLLRKHLSFEELLSFDLYLVSLEKAAYLGAEGEMIAAARLDNLTSAYASLYAIAEAKPQDDVLQLAMFWDHEEIGSNTWLGAQSSFLNQTLERISSHEKIIGDDFYRFMSRSWCVSTDLAHGFHPNYADRYDPKNAPWLGDGVVLKMNAQQRYATSASSAAPLIDLCLKNRWPLQKFASRADIPSGGTVGSIVSAICGVSTVDIGIAGWAMHSIRETISTQDQIALCRLLKEVLNDAPAM